MKNQKPGDSPEPIEEKIRGLSRDELLMTLRMRKHYQPEAAAAAVKEAIRRGLISTEEDLHLPEFDEPVHTFTLFPCPDNENARTKLFRSLLRGVMIAGIIPAVYGVMKFPLREYVEGVALISLGVVWIAMAWFIRSASFCCSNTLNGLTFLFRPCCMASFFIFSCMPAPCCGNLSLQYRNNKLFWRGLCIKWKSGHPKVELYR